MTDTHTPIVIQFEPAVLDANGSPVGDQPLHRLHITSPRSNRPGAIQSYPQEIVYNIPSDGLVRLQLVPSSEYLPVGRYRVRYYREGHGQPVEDQNWIVPQRVARRTFYYNYDTDVPIVMPVNTFSVYSVSPAYTFQWAYNQLLWTGSLPQEGERLAVEYQPAATLDELLDNETSP